MARHICKELSIISARCEALDSRWTFSWYFFAAVDRLSLAAEAAGEAAGSAAAGGCT
jgi:glycine cleavage system regulatory protein